MVRSPVFDVISARPMPAVALAMLGSEPSVPSTKMRIALALSVSVTLHLWLLPVVLAGPAPVSDSILTAF